MEAESDIETVRRERDFYRERCLAALGCVRRWCFNSENISNFKSLSRRKLLAQCATELREALGAIK